MSTDLHLSRLAARRNLVAIYVASFFAMLGFSFVTPLMPLFTLDLLHGDFARVGVWVGIAIGISPLLTALTGPWWGALGDRVGHKKMVQRALISIGVALALIALIDHPWQLVGLRAVIGALGGISVACLAAVTVSSSKQSLGRNVGYWQAAQTFGHVVGPLLGGGLALAAGMRPSFLMAAALFALALGLVTWLYKDLPKPMSPGLEPRTAEVSPEPVRLRGSLLFWTLLAVLFSASFLDGSFMVMLPLYLPALGAPGESLTLLAGLGLSGGALAMAISAALAGRLTSRFSKGSLLVVLLAASAVSLLGIVLAGSWWQFLALRVVLGFSAGALPALAYAASADLVPSARRGAIVGMASSAGLIGWGVAPLLVGFLVGTDARAVFIMDLLLVAGCVAALWWAGIGPRWRSAPSATRGRLAIFSR